MPFCWEMNWVVLYFISESFYPVSNGRKLHLILDPWAKHTSCFYMGVTHPSPNLANMGRFVVWVKQYILTEIFTSKVFMTCFKCDNMSIIFTSKVVVRCYYFNSRE